MNKQEENTVILLRWCRYIFLAAYLVIQVPSEATAQRPTGLSEINDALEDETDNVIQTGRIIANIIVVISFVLLMLNIVFKVMDNSKATVVFLFILLLRGLYEVIF